ncbi:protein FAM43A-like [Saccostrea echinata]|uniref:protein FAM43A-like n=1 Tax=Saccostrea echinata TaxID=191078 RepID=UPI002A7EFA98|nr:protein FAM43A-like [Saccostrea echinata]
MSLFGWRKNLSISDKEPTYKVRYLGNVQTTLMRGDGCVDKPVTVIWNNYVRSSHPGLDMKLTISSSGLRAHTKEQGVTEYRAHRISYCIAHPKYPRLFVWVYRHEGKKMKLELRCHAVLCKTEAKAKAMAVQLHEKLKFALKEFMREKTRKQNSRLVLQRTNSVPQSGEVLPKRTQILSAGKNFKPPISKSNTAPRLGAISEDTEQDEALEEESSSDIDDSDDEKSESDTVKALNLTKGPEAVSSCESGYDGLEMLVPRIIDLEIGNNLEELKNDNDVQYCLMNGDSDDESSESGFHEQDQDSKDGLNVNDDTSIGEDEVCDFPSGLENLVAEATEVTSL